MHLLLTPRQLFCLFYLLTLVSSCVLGVRSNDTKPQTCCEQTSNVHVKGRITRCAYVPARKKCLEAFVFLMENGKLHCSSMNARGIKATLKTLAQKGKPCGGITRM